MWQFRYQYINGRILHNVTCYVTPTAVKLCILVEKTPSPHDLPLLSSIVLMGGADGCLKLPCRQLADMAAACVIELTGKMIYEEIDVQRCHL